MPKRSSDADPMSEVVDRLLAQLSGAPSGPRNRWAPTRNGRGARAASTVVGSARDERALDDASPRELIGFWARVTLALLLGALMTQWPYSHDCGVALLGYTGAVVTVIVAGSWIAFASWRRRNAYAHVLALILAFWGVVLAAEQLLPRIGYAAEPATWQCDGEGFVR
ncbi:MAG: hypothetical protein ACREOF_05705 [Gemmatimonadales bacterium]